MRVLFCSQLCLDGHCILERRFLSGIPSSLCKRKGGGSSAGFTFVAILKETVAQISAVKLHPDMKGARIHLCCNVVCAIG